MTKVCCYIRCSTLDQSTEMQRSDLERYCKAHDLTPVFFEDYASGKSIKKRPALKDMMDRIKNGEFAECHIWKIDRINRNLRDFLELHAEMEKSGVKLVSFKDHLDFSTPIGRMLAQILSVFAELESSMISMRVSSGMAEAKKKGAKFGAKPIEFPLSLAQDLHKKGLTYTEIAKKLKVGRTTVCKHLKSDKMQ